MQSGVTINKSKFILVQTYFSGCINTIEAFDFSKQCWEFITTMPEGLRAHSTVALPDGLYITGGYNGKEYLNTLQK
jgi:N-acetylneuraminic acid mutarotase